VVESDLGPHGATGSGTGTAPGEGTGDTGHEPARAEAVAGAGPVQAGAPLRSAVEAILFVLDEPTAPGPIAQALGRSEAEILAVLAELRTEYDAQRRGFDLRETAGAWRLYTRLDHASYVELFLLHGQQGRLSRPALETLAIVAYRQPVSRAKIAAIRGVNVDGVVRTLLTRGLIEEAGVDAGTGSVLLRTTRLFLERLGLAALEDLPPIAQLLPDVEDVVGNDEQV
jgi:segregation and condensation protein B